jgi:two-component system response regulator HupR/HoxA
MPGRTGVEFLTEARERWPETVRILITGYTDPAAMAQAINDAGNLPVPRQAPGTPTTCLSPPATPRRLFQLSRENERMALEMRVLTATAESRVEKRRRALREALGFETILRAPNSPMNAVVRDARQFASFDVPVLLTGEPGTGKADLARAMHFGSLRSDRPFHALSLAGLPEDLAMIELFGAKRGHPARRHQQDRPRAARRPRHALSGQQSTAPRPACNWRWRGFCRKAASLRSGEPRSSAPMSGSSPGQTATCPALVADGAFRSDLYYALAVAALGLPPLRGRPGDIALLAQVALNEAATRHGKPVQGFEPEALEFLENYGLARHPCANWPTRSRGMLIFAQGRLLGADLISRPILQAPPGEAGADRSAEAALNGAGNLKDRVELVEMRILRETLARQRWNKSRAAAELGLSRVGLRAKLDRYGITQPGRSAAEQDEDD